MNKHSFEIARLIAEYIALKNNEIPKRKEILAELNRRLDDAKRKRELQTLPRKVHPWYGRMLLRRSG